jgi:TetR/AcrR family transcriptional regulator
MSEPGSRRRRGRVHDAQGAREAILNAAEEVFAEHGFDGARIDAIAKVAGYNKSLIFQYFGDKLGLYARVVRRADTEMSGLQVQMMAAMNEVGSACDADKFRTLLRTFMCTYFDYLVAHPRFTRILLWEMAEGWQTMAKIFSQRDVDEMNEFKPFLDQVQKAGLLRSDFDPMAQIMMIEFLYPSYLAVVPLFRILLADEELSSAAALKRARDYIIEFVIHGMVADPAKT